MKIDFSVPLKNLAGAPLLVRDGDQDVNMTLATAAVEALLAPGQQNEAGEQKFRAYQLAQRLYKAGEVDISPEEASYLKEKIGAHYVPAVVGPCFVLLNG